MFMAAQQCTVIYVGKRCKLLQFSNCGREKIYIYMEVKSNGIQALTKLKRQDKKVDAIILDIIMPEMDGYEFMNKIKQEKY